MLHDMSTPVVKRLAHVGQPLLFPRKIPRAHVRSIGWLCINNSTTTTQIYDIPAAKMSSCSLRGVCVTETLCPYHFLLQTQQLSRNTNASRPPTRRSRSNGQGLGLQATSTAYWNCFKPPQPSKIPNTCLKLRHKTPVSVGNCFIDKTTFRISE